MSPQVASTKPPTTAPSSPETPLAEPGRANPMMTVLERYGLLVVLVVLIIGFTIALPGEFLTSTNLKITLEGQAVILILAMAETIPLRAGDFDLSVAAVMVASASLIAVLRPKTTWR